MKFFVLKNAPIRNGTTSIRFSALETSDVGSAQCCPTCGRFLELLPLLPRVHLEIEAFGPRWADLALGIGNNLLVSSQFKTAFGQSKLKGLSAFSMVGAESIITPGRQLVDPRPDYFLSRISRSEAALDEVPSGVVRDSADVCPDCRQGGGLRRLSRIVFEPGTWSGEDVFSARGLPGTYLATGQFRNLCATSGFEGCEFIDTSVYSMDFYPQDGKR